jgi:hypothetical protein
MGELYGEFNDITNEWTDGLVAQLVRQVCWWWWWGGAERVSRKAVQCDVYDRPGLADVVSPYGHMLMGSCSMPGLPRHVRHSEVDPV